MKALWAKILICCCAAALYHFKVNNAKIEFIAETTMRFYRRNESTAKTIARPIQFTNIEIRLFSETEFESAAATAAAK